MISEEAYLGESSSGGGSSGSAEVNLAIEKATQEAQTRGLASPTIELVLLALLDEPSAQEILQANGADIESLRTALVSYINSDVASAPAGEPPTVESADTEDLHAALTSYFDSRVAPGPTDEPPTAESTLQKILSRATMKTYLTNKKDISGADILEAILVEKASFAAQALYNHGLALNIVENQVLERYLAKQQKADRRFKALRKKMEKYQEFADKLHDPGSARIEAHPSQPEREEIRIKNYLLRVTSEEPINFKAAISRDGRLDLYIEETPFETEFLATRLAALFDTIEGGVRLRVELITDIDGQSCVTAAFAGECGAIFEDPSGLNYQRSGRL